MPSEEIVKPRLAGRFPALADRIVLQRPRRFVVETPAGQFDEIARFAFGDLGFIYLCTITGLDEGDNLSFLYHLAHPDGTVLTLKRSVPKAAPTVASIGPLFPCGQIYERELVDMLGARVEGLPPGHRYPLPDGWPDGQYPLRKDWKPEMLDNPTANTTGGTHNG